MPNSTHFRPIGDDGERHPGYLCFNTTATFWTATETSPALSQLCERALKSSDPTKGPVPSTPRLAAQCTEGSSVSPLNTRLPWYRGRRAGQHSRPLSLHQHKANPVVGA